MRTLFLLCAVAAVAIAQQEVVTPYTLVCGDVRVKESNASLVWEYDNGNGFMAREGGVNITIENAKKAGTYTCTYNGVRKAWYIVGNFSAPTFVNARTSVTYNDGDHNRKITCESDSYPEPTFTWLRHGSLVGEAKLAVMPETNSNYEITTNGTRSVLKFQNVTYEEAQTFTCEVSNFVGNGSVEILIRVKSRYAAVWPFIGIVIEVVLLIIIIFVYEKRSKKVTEDVVSFTPSDDEKPLNRDEGVEIRNRHSNK